MWPLDKPRTPRLRAAGAEGIVELDLKNVC
jgi:hypothetical protein